MKGERLIKLTPIRSEKKMVEDFLIELHEILHNPKFHIDTDFIFICKKKASESEEYSTPYTMMELEFDTSDVLQVLDTLTIEDYSESLFDKDNDNPPILYVFGKVIQEKEVYIKLKIRKAESGMIVCVSFHYARHKMTYPYR